jgi:hypothetical protein
MTESELLALIDELERLQERVESWRKAKAADTQAWNRFHHIMKDAELHPGRTDDSLLVILDEHLKASKAEIERLRADAERYRWLRNDTSPLGWCAMNGTTPEKIDAVIDEAMGVGK